MKVETDFGFTAQRAKLLTSRKCNLVYCIIEDHKGQEWLVKAVLDGGRVMIVYKAGTDGKVSKHIAASKYKNYRIVLDENDVKG